LDGVFQPEAFGRAYRNIWLKLLAEPH